MQNQRKNFGDPCLERPFYYSRLMGNALYAKQRKNFGDACLERPFYEFRLMGSALHAKPEEELWGRLSGAFLLLIPADAECIVCKTRERIWGTLVWSVPFINSG